MINELDREAQRAVHREYVLPDLSEYAVYETTYYWSYIDWQGIRQTVKRFVPERKRVA